MGSDSWILWVVIVALVFLGAFFNSSETAFASCNRIRMKVRADDGNRSAKIVCKITDRFDRALITTVLGTNLVSVSISALSTLIFVHLFGGNVGSAVATGVATIIVYLFCDTLPKSLARALPDEVASLNGYFLYFLMFILTPITMIFSSLNKLFRKIFKMKKEPEITEEDFTNVIESIQEDGIIENAEGDIITSAIDFNDTVVKDVFTPKEKIFAIDITGLSPKVLNEILVNTNYSRIPFYKGTLDNIVGVLHVRNYVRDYVRNPNLSIRSSLGKPYFVTPKITMDELFEGFRRHKTHIAIVIDANKKVMGMVTMEDALEELVGNMDERILRKGGKK
jgi:putative hemolysin